ncbi:hypothetical protein DAERI_020300 [Deinococcus aerius]|uniref:Uncharacterized protein n=1 Tax=Deinococcus aerius TaxID=200253 RepID=A0A2I9CSN5_9DEIO|nr:hypothetical protein [Deinococcus aerius]GBF04703.1 hypothetical protein DAERI_020300 [Deinococcus aerius]
MVTLCTQGRVQEALTQYFEQRKKPGSEITLVEVGSREAYLAVTIQGMTCAFVVPLSPLDPGLCYGQDLLLMGPVSETRNPEPCQVSANFLKCLSPAPLFLKGDEGRWRRRAEHFVHRAWQSEQGEVLLGTYADARGTISYNEPAKKAFEQDARRYLKRLAKHLGRPALSGRKAVSYNPSGIACSGEAMLHLEMDTHTLLFVEVDAGGLCAPWQRTSPSGVAIMWRFEGQGEALRHEQRFFYPNQWVRWDTSARDFAALIEEGWVRLTQPTASEAGPGPV